MVLLRLLQQTLLYFLCNRWISARNEAENKSGDGLHTVLKMSKMSQKCPWKYHGIVLARKFKFCFLLRFRPLTFIWCECQSWKLGWLQIPSKISCIFHHVLSFLFQTFGVFPTCATKMVAEYFSSFTSFQWPFVEFRSSY